MKLFYADLSPYARKARAMVIEKDLSDRVESIAVNPYEIPDALSAANPLCKVPTLLTDDGNALYDSFVICEYLDRLGGGAPMVPHDGDARWSLLRRHALANGILDAAFNIATEVHRRDEDERSPTWLAHWGAAIQRAVGALEAEIGEWPSEVDLAHVTAGCALAYLEIRIPDHAAWREGRPTLTAWLDRFAERASMRATAPKV